MPSRKGLKVLPVTRVLSMFRASVVGPLTASLLLVTTEPVKPGHTVMLTSLMRLPLSREMVWQDGDKQHCKQSGSQVRASQAGSRTSMPQLSERELGCVAHWCWKQERCIYAPVQRHCLKDRTGTLFVASHQLMPVLQACCSKAHLVCCAYFCSWDAVCELENGLGQLLALH